MRFKENDIVKLHKDYDYAEHDEHGIKGLKGTIVKFSEGEYPIYVVWEDQETEFDYAYTERNLRLVERPKIENDDDWDYNDEWSYDGDYDDFDDEEPPRFSDSDIPF